MDENELSKKMLGVTNALFLEELAKGERCYLALRINVKSLKAGSKKFSRRKIRPGNS